MTRKPSLKEPEWIIQSRIAAYLSMIAGAAGLLFFSVPNEVVSHYKRKEYGTVQRLKNMGLTPGCADLVIIWQGRAFFLEVKTATGRLSSAQTLFKAAARSVGSKYAIVRSVGDVQKTLRFWKILS